MQKALTKESPVKTVNPATGETEKIFDVMPDAQIEGILRDAHETYGIWKETSVAARAALMRRIARGFRANREEMARLAAVEMGKLYREGLIEADLCARIFEYYAKNGRKILKDRKLDFPEKAYVMYEPIGVVMSIQPWNFPFSQVVRNAAPVILAGNTMVLKHASNVPQCAAIIEKVFAEAGAPHGLFSNLFIPGSKADELILDERVRGVTFTGGVGAGRAVAEAAGSRAKRCVLELSGIDPMVVLSDADVKFAAEKGVAARIRNAGQVCNAPKRMIVAADIYEEFIAEAAAILAAVKVGDPMDDTTGMGPLSSVKAAQDIKNQIDRSIRQGAVRVEYPGYNASRKGAFLMPVLLRDVRPGMTAFDEEIFGPVVTVVRAEDDEHAIELANNCRFALGASVFSKDRKHAERVARRIDAGMIGINTMAGSTPELPYGGTKDSGYGRELSELGVYEFSNPKLIRY